MVSESWQTRVWSAYRHNAQLDSYHGILDIAKLRAEPSLKRGLYEAIEDIGHAESGLLSEI